MHSLAFLCDYTAPPSVVRAPPTLPTLIHVPASRGSGAAGAERTASTAAATSPACPPAPAAAAAAAPWPLALGPLPPQAPAIAVEYVTVPWGRDTDHV